MDFKVLFHNPEELTQDELVYLSGKIRMQRFLPYTTAIFGGVAFYILNSAVLRHAHNWKIVGVGALAGFIVGGYGASQVGLPRPGAR